MILAIMQPYFLPYIGYWQLINAVDTFTIYDNIQFTKKGWLRRNNILIDGKKTLFTIPLEKSSDYLNVVDKYLAVNSVKQIHKILSQIKNSYRKAPYFKTSFPIIEDIFLNQEKNLFNYNLYGIRRICDFLDINTNIIISSKINIDHGLKSQDKVIAINKKLNTTKFINPIGGTELYDIKTFKKDNIELLFLKSEVPEYNQFNKTFIPSLSIIDIIMFNSVEDIKNMLEKYQLKKD